MAIKNPYRYVCWSCGKPAARRIYLAVVDSVGPAWNYEYICESHRVQYVEPTSRKD